MPAEPEIRVTSASFSQPASAVADQALLTSLRTSIAEAGDPARAPQMQRYMKSLMPFRGVSAVPLRALCREVLDHHRLPDRPTWLATLLALWDEASFREERYAALALARHRYYRPFQAPDLLDIHQYLVRTGAWWDYVDVVASQLVAPLLRSGHNDVAPVMRSWSEHDDLWVRRTAVLSQLGSKARTDTDLLEHVLSRNLEGSRHGGEFFVRKAVGWALREYARTDPDWVRDFVRRHDAALSGISRREALRHLG